MNLENVVLVRAICHLPLDGILLPSCEGKYLKPRMIDDYYYKIRKEVQKELEKRLGRSLMVWEDEDKLLLEDALKDYLPLTSSYTSTLSFSLNGLVPDDMNNKFSDMKIAVIEPIKYHQDEDYVNIDAIDTTIKGSIKTSEEAVLLVENNYFQSLLEEEKINLMNNYKVELFTGTLKDAVNMALTKYNYPKIPLIQRKEAKDIEECPKKESLITFQDEFAKEKGASRLKLQQLYMYPISTMSEIDALAAEKVKSDFDKNLVVEKYYKDNFYEFLIAKGEEYGIKLTEEEKYYLFSNFSNSEEILEEILNSIIRNIGLEQYKLIIQEYNKMVMENYLTNEEIVALNGEGRK